MSERRLAGSTSNTIYVLMRSKVSSPVGMGLTGLVYNTAGLVASYVRDGAARVAISLVTQTVTGAWSSGGFVEIDATNAPGLYRLDAPDAVFADGVKKARILWTGANSMDDGSEIDLPAYDPYAAPSTVTQIADGLLDEVAGVETGLTVRQWLRLAGAVLLGKASGVDSGGAFYRAAVSDSKVRVTATCSNGNRTSVTTDAT